MERTQCIAPSGAVVSRYGEKPKYAEGLYDLGGDVYAWLVPNGSWGEANAGLVVGDGASLLIDTLWDVPFTRAMLAAMEPLTARAPIATVVNSHGDGDHFYGNQLLAGAEIITTRAAARQMDHDSPATLLLLGRLGAALGALPFRSTKQIGHWFKAMCAPYDFASVEPTVANRTFDGRLDIACGGRPLRLIEVGPAHTAGDLIVHVTDAGILFAGDILFIGSTPVMWAGPLENWLKALDLIASLDVDVIVPGHGPLVERSGIEPVAAYWRFVAAAARDCFEAGVRPNRAARDIVTSADFRAQGFLEWDSPERMVMNCHMLYREFEGKTGPLTTAQILNILRHQALLANALPQASPAIMRLKADQALDSPSD